MYHSYLITTAGMIEIEANEQEVLTILFRKEKQVGYQENELSKMAKRQLEEYFNWERTTFDFPFALKGSEFQKKVWGELFLIPYGETISYQQIAINIGNKKASRAVGTAVGKNMLLILLPCHRVIGVNGSLTGYAAGLEVKKSLLALEERGTRNP